MNYYKMIHIKINYFNKRCEHGGKNVIKILLKYKKCDQDAKI